MSFLHVFMLMVALNALYVNPGLTLYFIGGFVTYKFLLLSYELSKIVGAGILLLKKSLDFETIIEIYRVSKVIERHGPHSDTTKKILKTCSLKSSVKLYSVILITSWNTLIDSAIGYSVVFTAVQIIYTLINGRIKNNHFSATVNNDNVNEEQDNNVEANGIEIPIDEIIDEPIDNNKEDEIIGPRCPNGVNGVEGPIGKDDKENADGVEDPDEAKSIEGDINLDESNDTENVVIEDVDESIDNVAKEK